jgi:hypothetical protein
VATDGVLSLASATPPFKVLHFSHAFMEARHDQLVSVA